MPLLTYATRGMEPLRGFAEFLRAKPAQQQPRICMLLGTTIESSSYGSHESGSWRQLLEELDGQLDLKRPHFPANQLWGATAAVASHLSQGGPT